MQPLPVELLCLSHLLVFPVFIADSGEKYDPAFQTAGAKRFLVQISCFWESWQDGDWSEENLAFGIESFELFVYARERCFECSRSWQEAPQVVKGVIRQSPDFSEFWKILAIKATEKTAFGQDVYGQIVEYICNIYLLRDFIRAYLHGTTLSNATSLRQAYDTNCFV